MNFSNIIVVVFVFFMSLNLQSKDQTHIQLLPETGLMTETIQKAINACSEKGGGVVLFSTGTYLSGGIELKSKVTLKFEKGVILQGSDKYSDYKNDAFIFGKDLTDIAIRGEAIIDGVDCINKQGEEGFRGPHCIRLINCKNISLEGFTIKNSANWAINCRHCSLGKVDQISIRGGHDGLHTRFCDNFKVTNCDFLTGDDAFAGNDNRDFMVTNCKVNTSCNGFRMGCQNFTVKHCQIWGPGESVHKIQKRNNMLSAFVHFSPKDENPKIGSGNWLIEDVTVENVDQFYVYNFKDGLWQTGQPVTNVSFKNVKATGVLGAFNIFGDSNQKFNLSVENSSFAFREGTDYKGETFEGAKLLSPAMFNASSFDQIQLRKVTLSKRGTAPLMNCISVNLVSLDLVSFISNNPSEPFALDKIGNTKISNNKFTQADTK
jgi:polygalacturonase